jgi:hypothetical protein
MTTKNSALVGLAELIRDEERRYVVEPIAGLGNVRLRSIFESERQEIARSLSAERESDRVRASSEMDCRFIVFAVVDADGKLLLSEEHVASLMRRDAGIVNRLSAAIQRHWGLTETVESVKKNSSATPSDDSPSN